MRPKHTIMAESKAFGLRTLSVAVSNDNHIFLVPKEDMILKEHTVIAGLGARASQKIEETSKNYITLTLDKLCDRTPIEVAFGSNDDDVAAKQNALRHPIHDVQGDLQIERLLDRPYSCGTLNLKPQVLNPNSLDPKTVCIPSTLSFFSREAKIPCLIGISSRILGSLL